MIDDDDRMVEIGDLVHAGTDPGSVHTHALLFLHVERDNVGAGMDEHYRLAWWDDPNQRWQLIDSESWVMQTIEPGSAWLRAWLDLDSVAYASPFLDAGPKHYPTPASAEDREEYP